MLTEIEKVLPSEIEKRSFEIIAEELGDKQLIPGTESIVKRCIHTSADFDYADNLIFSENVVEKALKAIYLSTIAGKTFFIDPRFSHLCICHNRRSAADCF